MNNKIIKNLIAFSFVVFVLFVAKSSFAAIRYDGFPDYSTRTYTVHPAFIPVPSYQVYQQNDVNYYPNTNSGNNGQLTAYNDNVNKNYNVTKTSTTNKTVTKTSDTDTSKNSNNQLASAAYAGSSEDQSSNSCDSNSLTALSVKGDGGFMPSSVWQWVLVVLLILAIIVIARVLAKKYTVHEVYQTVPNH